MSTLKDKVTSFFKKYSVRLIDDNKRRYKESPRTQFFVDPKNKDIIYDISSTENYETEKILTVEIPESMLTRIVEIESTFFNNIDDVSQRRIFAVWLEQQHEEQYLRAKHPGIKQAFEAYCTLLHLAGGNHSKFKDLDD